MGNLLSIPYDFDRSITEKDVSESMDKIRELPRVTPRELRKGHWIEKWDSDHLVILAYECSECGMMMNVNTSHYCPNCGADMREGEE